MGRFFTYVFPVKRFCHRVVEVQNKVHDLEAQMGNRYEITSSEQAPCQDAKPNLNLISLWRYVSGHRQSEYDGLEHSKKWLV